eukprot:gene21666-47579_t
MAPAKCDAASVACAPCDARTFRDGDDAAARRRKAFLVRGGLVMAPAAAWAASRWPKVD